MMIGGRPLSLTPVMGGRVGVVMPAYNVERFIEEAGRSVMAQTYTDWEMVIVDDGSTDRTGERAEELRRAAPERITLLRQEWHGQGSARAKGFERISPVCSWLLFMDADDVIEPQMMASLIAGAVGRRISAITGSSTLINADGKPCNWLGEVERGSGDRRFGIVEAQEVTLPQFAAGKKIFPPSMVLMKRDYYEAAGGFLSGMPAYEDEDLLARMLLHAPIWASGRRVCQYRRRPGQLTANDTVMASGQRLMERKWSLYKQVYEEMRDGDSVVG